MMLRNTWSIVSKKGKAPASRILGPSEASRKDAIIHESS
ncbi:hypothetical protein JI435_408090 [Parastagonospora nodorum SN15]|uniref:Uncharacterized protein n=1 Tax=Phaeosphaeria nodorum (strain SN15 / ATCC MYA-4574 / FGSC 10173) TaxID=321614 RepID=A0A7U2EZC3_PHANO|nr:hypothetical protein JI435_408090 [Parastagonospora nodorum SN15]